MTEPLRSAAEAAASRLLATTGRDVDPRVDVHKLALAAGVHAIKVVEQQMGDGRLARQGERSVIFVQARSGPTRQRYTVAHELGHFWLRHHDHVLRDSLTHHDEERFCNIFAAALLLPPRWVAAQGRAEPATLDRLREIAGLADVSVTACFISLGCVPQWRKSLLHWRRVDSAWRLNSVVGITEQVRRELSTSAQTEHALGVVERLPSGAATCDLPLELRGVPITTRAEVAIMADGAIALTDLPPSPVEPAARRRSIEPFALLSFAVPRGPAPRVPSSDDFDLDASH